VASWSHVLRLPSRAYATAYLLAIPAFGLIYYLLPDHFYHSTGSFDPAIARQRQHLSRSIADDLQNRYCGGPRQTDGFTVTNTISLDGDAAIAYEDTAYHAAAFLTLPFSMWVKAGDSSAYGFNGDVQVMVIAETAYSESTLAMARRTNLYPAAFVAVNVHQGKPVPHDVNPVYARAESLAHSTFGDHAYVKYSNVLGIWRYIAASRGQTGYSDASIGRAMYLSAVTITTLGYGDIVPMTDAGRLLVATEAVLGVVLAGLFLNALARQTTLATRNPPSGPAPPPAAPE
jgi:hypothetical protein